MNTSEKLKMRMTEVTRRCWIVGPILALTGLIGCTPMATTSRNQQTMNRLHGLNDELREEREKRLRQRSPTPAASQPVAVERRPKTSGEHESTDVDRTSGDETSSADPKGQDDPEQLDGTLESIVDRSGVTPVKARRPPAATDESSDPLRVPSTRSRGGESSAWSYLEATRRDLVEEKRRWELRRLQDEIKALQEARVRDAYSLSGWANPGRSSTSALTAPTAPTVAVARELDALKQQQRETAKQLATLRSDPGDLGGRRAAARIKKLEQTLAQQRAETARLARVTAGVPAEAASSRATLKRLQEEVRSELKKTRRLRDELARRPPAPAVPAVVVSPAAGRSRSTKPRRSAVSPQQSRNELDAQMELAEQMLRQRATSGKAVK